MTAFNTADPVAPGVCACAHSPDIRILHRVATLDAFPVTGAAIGTIRRVSIVDVETTGTDPAIDEIIDVALVTIHVDEAGNIVEIVSAGEALRDPGMPIPAAITMITGITDADVAGKSIHLDRLEQRLASASVRIAHNCAFDLAFLERLMPGLAGLEWACSANDFDWLDAGFDGRKLGHLLMQAGWFNVSHRAMADVVSLLHLLAHRLDDGTTVIGRLLENAARPTVRIEATGADFDKRSMLKARGYRWDTRRRVWWTEIEQTELEAETLWLNREAEVWGSPHTKPITWCERHR